MLLSVIIPALNEAPHIGALLAALRAMERGKAQLEIIISDGGSIDDTAAIARAAGATVIQGARGRGAQMSAGAQIARGDALWFVHADAHLHPQSVAHIARCMTNSAVCGGNFRLRFCGDSVAARVFARIARQQRRLSIYYGDSGIWTRRAVYQALGGFRDWPLFEDYDFARRMERFARGNGQRTDCAPWPIYASPRRFHNQPVRVCAQWLTLQVLFSCGVSPARLARLYYQGKM
jgi:rSAM/selenodomain-associated transferase 2